MNIHVYDWMAHAVVLLKVLKAVGIVPGIAATMWGRRWLQQRRQEKACYQWTMAEAHIFCKELHHEGYFQNWIELTYSYQAGECRIGSYYRHFYSKPAAIAFFAKLNTKKIPVRYNPSNPEQSAIMERDIDMVVPIALEVQA